LGDLSDPLDQEVHRERSGQTIRINFDLVKKRKKSKSKKRDVHYTRRTYIQKRQTTLACRPCRVVVVLPCVSGVVYLCRDTFFIDFSAATVCYHYIHIAFFLHNFDRFSYSLSTTSYYVLTHTRLAISCL
jgi:hypothetical protein